MDSAERRRELYKALQATCADAPLTTNKLAELLHVSVRTVHYDLDTLSEESLDYLVDVHFSSPTVGSIPHAFGVLRRMNCSGEGQVH